MPKPTVLACTLAVCGAAVAVGLSAAPASAASADLQYTCDWGIGDAEGTGDPATASWDSGIADDLEVPVGTSVDLDPYSGTVTLPDAFVAELRAQDRTELSGGGLQLTVVEETEEPIVIDLAFETTPVPADGPMVLELEGVDADPIEATEPGTYTLLASDFIIGSDLDENLGLLCEMTDEGDATIDAFEAVGEPTETPTATVAPTVTVTATPVRPALVQTDVAEGTPSGGTGGLALAGGAAALLAVAGRLAVRRAPRRH
jgi:uncharacterized protein DUF6801